MEPVQQTPSDPQDVPTEKSEAAAAESGDAPATESALPVPVETPAAKRSLWRRLTSRREARRADASGFQDLVKSRLDGITLRLESFEHTLARNDARLVARLELLERIEGRLEALADIGERADRAQAAARTAAEAASEAARTARIAAIVAGFAGVVAAAALLSAFY